MTTTSTLMSSTTFSYSSLFLISTLLFSTASATDQQLWDPSLEPRQAAHLVKPRAPRTGPLKSRLAKRQTSQNPAHPSHPVSNDKTGGFGQNRHTEVSATQYVSS